MRKALKFKGDKSVSAKRLILNMLDVFEQIGLPLKGFSDRRLEMMAMATLVISGIKRSFREAKDGSKKLPMKTRDIIENINENFGETVSKGSYDDIRRRYLISQVEYGCVVNSAGSKATNDPTRGYSITPSFAKLLRSYGKKEWKEALNEYHSSRIIEKGNTYSEKLKASIRVAVGNNDSVCLSPGQHNELQRLIVEEFLPVLVWEPKFFI